MADSKKQTPAEEQGVQNPWASGDPAHQSDKLDALDPTKVVGTYAEQPDPNDDVPGPPPPNVPKGVNKAPKDDDEGAGAIGEGKVK
jgi:hypothetical protein